MIKKYILMMAFLIPIEVFATSGRLRSESITNCNGKTYGQHGDGHWHLATSNNGIWYADEEELGYISPCQEPQSQPESPPQSTQSTQVPKTSEPVIEETNDITTVSSENDQQIENIKSSNKNAKILYNGHYLNFDENNISNIETNEEKISFKIELEDKNATSNLKDNYEIKDKESIIEIIVTAEDKTNMKYTINVHRKEKKIVAKTNKQNEENNIFTITATFGILFCFFIVIKAFLCNEKKKRKIMIFCGLLGWLGIHRFVNKNIKIGLLYVLTIGVFGFGWVFDELLILTNKFKYNIN